MSRPPIKVEVVGIRLPRTDLIVAIIALIVAICAVGVSVWQGYKTLEHFRILVKPHVDFAYYMQPDHKRPGLYVINSGLGPGVITKVELYLDGNPVTNWNDMFHRIRAEKVSVWKTHQPMWTEIGGQFHIPKDEIIPLFSTTNENNANWQEFERLYTQRIAVRLRYCSMYGDSWEMKTRHGRIPSNY
jgi:hypothetical protein